MAELRQFDYVNAKKTMGDIQDKSDEIKKILEKCDTIIKDNVGVEDRWSGQRADDFKRRWDKAASEFGKFIDLINTYPAKIDESHKAHQQYEQRG